MREYRIKYKRDERVQFVSHLDTIQVFARAGRRANLPLTYSKGFNPKPDLVFGAPAAMGMTSSSEILDIKLDKEIEIDELVRRFNENLPAGFEITRCEKRTCKDNIMKQVGASSYNVAVSYEGDTDKLKATINKILEANELIVPKKTKRGYVDRNVRNMIYDVSIDDNNQRLINMTLQSGNNGSLKPELLVETINKIEESLKLQIKSIHRSAILIKKGEKLKDPFEMD